MGGDGVGKASEESLSCRFLWCHLQAEEDLEPSSALSLCSPGKGEETSLPMCDLLVGRKEERRVRLPRSMPLLLTLSCSNSSLEQEAYLAYSDFLQ